MIEPQFFCYRLTARLDYDEELIWSYVQRTGGSLSIRGDCIDFWIPGSARLFLICAWPDLEPRPDQNLI